jgi:hypothetical protein
LSPFTTNVGAGATLEDLAANPLTIGSQLGARTAASGAQSGNFLMQGAANAAPYAYKAASYNPLSTALIGAGTNPSLSSGIANWWNTTPQWTPQQFQQQQAATYGSANAGFGGAGGFFD